MRVVHKTLVTFLLALALCAPLHGQVRPLPRNPIEAPPPAPASPEAPRDPSRPAVPRENPVSLPAPSQPLDRGRQAQPAIPRFSPPVLELAGATQRHPGRLQSLSVRVSNVGNARAVHLFSLDFGCPVDVQPATRGHQLFMHPAPVFNVPAARPRLTSDRGSRVQGYAAESSIDITFQDLDGVPVDRNGVASFVLSGVVGVTPFFTRDVHEQPDVTAMQTYTGHRAGAYDPYLRQVPDVSADHSTCIPSAVIALKDETGQWHTFDEQGRRLPLPARFERRTLDTPMPMIVRGKPWFLTTSRRVTVEHTSQLARLFSASVKGQGPGSICDDTSRTPHGTFPVGVRERDRDLAFVVRSGPLGTRCRFEISSATLPDGVAYVNAEFAVSRVGDQCTVDSPTANVPGGVFQLDRISRATKEPVILTGQGRVGGSSAGWLNPYVYPDPGLTFRWQRNTAPMIAYLDCKPTLLNDHEVALIMRRATFMVTEGVQFP